MKNTAFRYSFYLVLLLSIGCKPVMSQKKHPFTHPGGIHPKEKTADVREKIKQGNSFYVSELPIEIHSCSRELATF